MAYFTKDDAKAVRTELKAAFPKSSSTVAAGPGIVDYGEWQRYFYEVRETIEHVHDINTRKDLKILFENVQRTWIEYSSASLRFKKRQPHLYKRFEEAKETLGKHIMMAGLMGL